MCNYFVTLSGFLYAVLRTILSFFAFCLVFFGIDICQKLLTKQTRPSFVFGLKRPRLLISLNWYRFQRFQGLKSLFGLFVHTNNSSFHANNFNFHVISFTGCQIWLKTFIFLHPKAFWFHFVFLSYPLDKLSLLSGFLPDSPFWTVFLLPDPERKPEVARTIFWPFRRSVLGKLTACPPGQAAFWTEVFSFVFWRVLEHIFVFWRIYIVFERSSRTRLN